MTETKADDVSVLAVCRPRFRELLEQHVMDRAVSRELHFSFQRSVERARDRLRTECFDLLFIDYDLPCETGLLFHEQLKVEGLNLPRTILGSLNGSEKLASEWFRRGGDGYVSGEHLKSDSFSNAIRDILYASKTAREEFDTIYRDSVTGLWNPRYMLRLFDEERLGGQEDYPVGCSMIDVGGFPSELDENSSNEREAIFKKLGKKIRSVVAHTGFTGRYWGSMFWIFVRNKQVKRLSGILRRVLHEIDQIQGKHSDDEPHGSAGAIVTRNQDFNFDNFQQRIDRTLFKAKQFPGSRLMIGRL